MTDLPWLVVLGGVATAVTVLVGALQFWRGMKAEFAEAKAREKQQRSLEEERFRRIAREQSEDDRKHFREIAREIAATTGREAGRDGAEAAIGHAMGFLGTQIDTHVQKRDELVDALDRRIAQLGTQVDDHERRLADQERRLRAVEGATP